MGSYGPGEGSHGQKSGIRQSSLESQMCARHWAGNRGVKTDRTPALDRARALLSNLAPGFLVS